MSGTAPSPEVLRGRVLALLKRHGWNASSFQTLESQFRYWFDASEACVAYVDTGGAWVAAGAPLAPDEQMGAVAERFIQAARAQGRRAAFFGTEHRFVERAQLRAVQLGEQPSWDPALWPNALKSAASLREQLRRARAKGVQVRALHPSELLGAHHPTRGRLERLLERWTRAKKMPPMRFLVELEPFTFFQEKRAYVAEVRGEVVGMLALVPVYRRRGWLFEDLIRDPGAPNGTMELLIDHAMRAAACEGSGYVTLGMVPLSGAVGAVLKAARYLGRGLYDFEGLRRFKAKLQPDAWTPIYLSHPPSVSRARALLDVLTAFAGGSLLRFGWRALFAGPAFFVRLLALMLVPWTLALACAPASRWFPSRSVWAFWILFDVGLMAALWSLARRWRTWLGLTIASAVTADAGLTLLEAVLFNVRRAGGLGAGLVVAVAVLAPTVAAAFLWRVVAEKLRREGSPGAHTILKFPAEG